MTLLVTIALYGWIPISLILFREIRGYRAVIFCFITGTLFLPEYTFEFSGLPDFSKAAAISYGVVAAALIFDPGQLFRLRFCWFDIPILIFCFVPIPSALANNLSIMDGISTAFVMIFNWGAPYFIGRIFLTSFDAMRSTVKGIFLGGVAYIPFCLFEVRMSPQLNNIIYGFRYGDWGGERFGGFRPNVFLKTGLELGMWMTAAVLCGYCLMRFRITKKFFGIKVSHLFACLLVTTVLCKATGAMVLLSVSIGLLYLWQKTRWRFPIILLSLFPLLYIGLRVTGAYDFSHVTELARETVGADRAHSFNFRIVNEDILAEHALQRPLFGWAGYGRNRVMDDAGKDIAITDGYWVIVLGCYGLIGLSAFYFVLSAIPILCISRFSAKRYRFYDAGALVALSLFTIILSVDCLLNAFWVIVYPLFLGGLTSVYLKRDSKLFDTTDLEERVTIEPSLQTRRLWPPPPQMIESDSTIHSNDFQQITTAAEIDTIEDESTIHETR